MENGFLKVAVSSPDLKVADCQYNKEQLVKKTIEMDKESVKLLVFPELSLTGYTCGDLFLQDTLLRGAKEALFAFAQETKQTEIVAVLGMPLEHKGKLYNVAVVVDHGSIRGVVPKTFLPNYGEFYEARQFSAGFGEIEWHTFENGEMVPFGSNQIFADYMREQLCFGVEICEDLWMPNPPSTKLVSANALIVVNLSASNELIGKSQYRRELVRNQSARAICAYLYADAGEGESTTDMVYAGHNMIAENGIFLAESKPFSDDKDLITEIDLEKLQNERRRMGTFFQRPQGEKYPPVLKNGCQFGKDEEVELTRIYVTTPFVPDDPAYRKERCREIMNIQSNGLAKRLRHIGCRHAVIGLSGGLDSTLALVVTVCAFELLQLPREGIICVTMTCFGTTDRTYDNALKMAKELGTTLREIPIKEAVLEHFENIGQDKDKHDITYENSQARERTQILMDIANQVNGLVIGTGDMSELALGWATYNGDHMSMYGVNCSVPKTLVRYLVQFFADVCGNDNLKEILYDVMDTPISPELLPPQDGEIAQKTEDIVGPYELHDFFLYYMLRFGFSPKKIFRLAVYAFEFDYDYDKETIFHWLSIFCHRFFRQQYKRSCLPDGPKVGTVSLSPRGDLRMPSDVSDALWQAELDSIRDSLV